MAENTEAVHSVSASAAQQLSNITKTPPVWQGITPRWLVAFLPWTPVEAGVYRINRVKQEGDALAGVACSLKREEKLPETFFEYEDQPRENTLNAVTTIVTVQTRVSDLYRSPFDQVKEQLRLNIERIKERQEDELINNAEYGLLNQPIASQRISTRAGVPTPDDFDELISLVWKEPAFFLAHPKAVAAFGRECTRRGVPPPTVTLFGNPFITWRGLPLVPCDKLRVTKGKSNILLVRTGEKKQGVTGLFQPGLPGEVTPGLSVRFMGINEKAIASYLISLYCSAAVLSDDAIAVLENVEIGKYHEYKHDYK